ncbi:MAG: HicA protein [Methylococcales symbiont of Hymedesmia sp. n. MRB-2018]|nr:MAG: HicA protein [Methylococcales symbiont of Iophon sp. n. MRB-2018]KAF3983946.1 MAG: HicA protein [Methylococcales symbiont of Hymedesmia sp. n. MRB-2018]SMN02377.1 HicA protein [uncultured Candidatus Thioglobus sp.]
MNDKKLLAKIFQNPINSGIHWADIEKMLRKIEGLDVIEGAGSKVAFYKKQSELSIHRPHPSKESLRYRVKLVREFLIEIGEV